MADYTVAWVSKAGSTVTRPESTYYRVAATASGNLEVDMSGTIGIDPDTTIDLTYTARRGGGTARSGQFFANLLDANGAYLARRTGTPDSTAAPGTSFATYTHRITVGTTPGGIARVALNPVWYNAVSGDAVDLDPVVSVTVVSTTPQPRVGANVASSSIWPDTVRPTASGEHYDSLDWTVTARPSGSTAALTGSTTASPSLIPDAAGGYSFEVTATGAGGTATATCSTNVRAQMWRLTEASGRPVALTRITSGGGDGGGGGGSEEPAPPPAETTSYESAVMADNPQGFWKLDETSGTTLDDRANAHSLTLSGGVLGVPSLAAEGTAIAFDGVDDGATRANTTIGVGSTFAFDLQFEVDVLGKFHSLMSNAVDEGNDGTFLAVTTDNKLAFTVALNSTTKATAFSATVLEAGVPYYAGCSYNGSTVSMYLRKVADASVNTWDAQVSYSSGVTWSSTRTFALGRQVKSFERSTRYLQGVLDNPAWYDDSLSLGAFGTHHDAARAAEATAPAPTILGMRSSVDGQVAVAHPDNGTGITSVRLKLATDEAMTQNVQWTTGVTPNAVGVSKHTVPGGLTAGVHYYQPAVTTAEGEGLATGNPGRLRILPTGTPVNHRFALSSCSNGDSGAYVAIRQLYPWWMHHMGDLWYKDDTGTNLTNFRSVINHTLTDTNLRGLLAEVPFVATHDDHDAMSNDGTGGPGSSASEVEGQKLYNQVHREQFPGTLPAGDLETDLGIYRTWACGRVRYIALDCKTFATDPDVYPSATDATKTVLGSAQKTWLEGVVTNSAETLFVVEVSFPWVQNETYGDDMWGSYIADRDWLLNLFTTAGKTWGLAIHGDQHALSWHDGTVGTANPGGIPTFGAAPLLRTSSHKGGPYTAGPIPSTTGTTVRQFGLVNVDDDGSTITFTVRGYLSDSGGAASVNFGPFTKSYTVA